MAYELSKAGGEMVQPTVEAAQLPAAHVEIERLYRHLESALENTRYFYPPERAAATKITLRNILTKPAWTEEEVRTLRGVVSALERPPRND